MADTRYQNDFFSEGAQRESRNKPRLLNRLSEHRFLPHVRIPVEYTVIVAIGVLVLVIISYAVGVESGKKMSGFTKAVEDETVVFREQVIAEKASGKKRDEVLPVNKIDEVEKIDVLAEGESEASSTDPYDGARKEFMEEKPLVEEMSSAEGVYVIQLAAFKEKSRANEEVEALKWKGVDAGIDRSGNWYQVYARGYRTIEEAREARTALIGEYEDCYIRKVK